MTLPITPNVGLSNALMAAPKNHIFQHAIQSLEEASNTSWRHLGRHMHVVGAQGPCSSGILISLTKETLKKLICSRPKNGKCSLCERCIQTPNSFLHLQGDSWHKWDSKFWSYTLQCYPVPILGILIFIALAVTLHHGPQKTRQELQRRFQGPPKLWDFGIADPPKPFLI